MKNLALNTARFVAAGILAVSLSAGAALASEGAAVESQSWTFTGPFGTFDRAQLQRGYKVYKEVCANCHSMKLVKFRNLADPGGPGFTEEQVKVLAAEYEVTDGPNDDGDMFERPAKPYDAFVSPFANDNAARASNGGALPPDFSVIAKARPNGPNYIYALLTGYEEEPPAGVELRDGMNYNHAFTGNQIAMAPPLSEEIVEYTDGSPMTVDQYAHDVVSFLMWAAEPKLEERKRMGLQITIFLLAFAGLLYFTKQKLWSDVDH
ncbi:MAG: cytochrome c1 [Rhodobiaceae bacterium]|nr:cytochrome c1 [Rhodobiaceae bacterium]MCC0061284.1 cytochrome c1 [Rhodobiaceae bacterium]